MIEEDGKTEEEFIELIENSRSELTTLTEEAQSLSDVIDANLDKLLDSV